MDVGKLITAVQKRRPLWDRKDKLYGERRINANLWDEVAKEMKKPKDEVHKKWKNLRDSYRLAVKRGINKHKSASGAGGLERKWSHFDEMSFLDDVMSPITANGTEPEIESDESATSDPKRRKSNKRKTTANEDLQLEIEKEKLNILKSTQNLRLDGDYNFLISLLPIMKNMSNMQKLEFRAKVGNIALDIMNDRKSTVSSNLASSFSSQESTSFVQEHFIKFDNEDS
uniref:MADF domain-containing protein n=1 Tax=Glossina brevipalpis TaxID=37001 RepID=A0A1A9X4V7_9MUSC